MTGYPGGADLGLEDAVGAQFSLVWGAEQTAEIAVNDGYEGRWSSFNADRDQLLKIAFTILSAFALTPEVAEKIRAFPDQPTSVREFLELIGVSEATDAEIELMTSEGMIP